MHVWVGADAPLLRAQTLTRGRACALIAACALPALEAFAMRRVRAVTNEAQAIGAALLANGLLA